jgi:hypothetical protein
LPFAIAQSGDLRRVRSEVDQEVVPPSGLKRELIINGMLEDDLLVFEAFEDFPLLQFLRRN